MIWVFRFYIYGFELFIVVPLKCLGQEVSSFHVPSEPCVYSQFMALSCVWLHNLTGFYVSLECFHSPKVSFYILSFFAVIVSK